MTTLNGIQIPEFSNHDEVVDFIDNHSDKLYLHFLEDDGKIERNAILSKNEAENNEWNQTDVKHCLCCGGMDIEDDQCSDCSDEDDE